jgi:hypothetical protein
MMPKLTIVGRPNLDPATAKRILLQKVEALLPSDAQTPVIGDMLRAKRDELQKTLGKRLRSNNVLIPIRSHWKDAWHKLGAFPNNAEPWMLDLVNRQIRLLPRASDAPPLVEVVVVG